MLDYEYMLSNFLKKNIAKSKRKQKLWQTETKMRASIEGKKEKKLTQLATAIPLCVILNSSYLFGSCSHFSFAGVFLPCRKFPWSNEHVSKVMLKAAHRQKLRFFSRSLTLFSFSKRQITLKRMVFSCSRRRKERCIFFFVWLF